MRITLAGLACLISSAILLAAGADKPTGKPIAAMQAQKYALAILRTSGLVAAQYLRPVSRADVVRAALEGLHEAAHQPVPGSLAGAVLRADGKDEELLALIQQTRERLGDLEPLREPNDILASLRGMTRVLDPHCGVITADEVNRGDGVDPSAGLGLDVPNNFGVGPLAVKTVLPGGPAQKAGVRPGDRITHVDGKPVEGSPAAFLWLRSGAASALAPASDRPSRVELTLARASAKPLRVTLEPEDFRSETVLGVARQEDNDWVYWIDRPNRIAHVRIATLANGTAEELDVVLRSLQEQGLRGLILDLRWCPGGVLPEAVNVAQLFVGGARVATVKTRDGKLTEYRSTNERKCDVPLLVLVNGATSGGAELIAAAIQDNRRARVAGQRTLGKGSVQSLIFLPIPNLQLKLTSGTFLRPSGKNMHRFADSKPTDDWGVRPDPGLEFPVTPALGKQLKEWWLAQTLRPGASREILPLDDPSNDPQRQDAIRALVKRIKVEG